MPAAPGPTSKRKPPVPSNDHAVIATWLDQVMPALRPIVVHLDGLIRGTVPDAQYALKWKKAYYGLPDQGWLIEMVAYDVSVNLVFFAGARFDPLPPLGEDARYVKITTIEEAKAPAIRAWIEQAPRHPGWR